MHARDQKSGKVLRCEVVIDKISRIAIFHTVLKIDLEGLATLQIRAFDEEGALFQILRSFQALSNDRAYNEALFVMWPSDVVEKPSRNFALIKRQVRTLTSRCCTRAWVIVDLNY